MKAVIMVGGQGLRLRPLTCQIPKPMVPLLGRPVLEYGIELLKREGFQEIALTSFYQPHVLEKFFSQGEAWGVYLEYFIERKPLGTAGSVRNAKDFLDETFLVMSGDALSSLPLQKAYQFHCQKGALATLLVKEVQDPREYGVVMMNQDGRITRFLEKPSWGQVFSDTVNTGIYILEPEILSWIKEGVPFDFSKDLFPLLLEKGAPLYAYVAEGYWSDIGTLKEYRQAHLDLMTGKIQGNRKFSTHTKIFLEKGVDIPYGVNLEGPLYIGSDTRIGKGANISSTVIGAGCSIGEGAFIQNSILWDHVHIGPYSEIGGAILGESTILGEQVILEEESVLGNHTRVGDLSLVQSGVKVWPRRYIGQRSKVSSHLVKNHHQQSIFGEHGVSGEANLHMTPEISSLLGSSFGSLMPPGSTILITSDHHLVSWLNAKALKMGLLSTGMKVVDGGETIIPVLRNAIRTYHFQGGIHVHLKPQKSKDLILEFFDNQGLNLSREKERELERIYDQRSLRKAPLHEITPLVFWKGLEEDYLKNLFAQVRGEGGLQVLSSYVPNPLASLLQRLLERMGCQLLCLEEVPMELKISHLREALLEVKGDLGIILDPGGESLTLLTGEGHILDSHRFQVLLALLFLERGFTPLIFPVTAPLIIEDLAGEGEVLWTGVHHHQVQSTLFQVHGDKGLTSPFQDALVTLAWILDLLMKEGISLEELSYSIPPFFRIVEVVESPWEEKGRILRNLVSKEGLEKRMVEGVSFSHQGTNVLILPHGQKPLFHIYTEASSHEEAKRVALEYKERILSLLG